MFEKKLKKGIEVTFRNRIIQKSSCVMRILVSGIEQIAISHVSWRSCPIIIL